MNWAAISVLLFALMIESAFGQQTVYRWLDPSTGKYVTTPKLPPYPIKEKRPDGANLPGLDMVNVDLDLSAPEVKAAIAKREAEKAEEQRKEREREEQKARLEQEKREKERAEDEYFAKMREAKLQLRDKECNGDLSFGIKLGMTGEQVEACMLDINNGRPYEINTMTSVSGQREQWVYKVSGGRWYFYFTNDRLTTVQQY